MHETVRTTRSAPQTSVLCRIYESVDEMAKYAGCVGIEHWQGLRSLKFVGHDFGGKPSEVLKRVAVGDSHGASTIEQMLSQAVTWNIEPPKSRRRRLVWSEDFGEELSIDRIREGRPDFWRACHREIRHAPVVESICIDMATPKDTAPRDVFWRGAAAIAAASLLEVSGRSIELWAFSSLLGMYQTDPKAAFIACRIKEPSQLMDVRNVATACSAWFYRTVNFTSRCCGREADYDAEMGTPTGPFVDLLREFCGEGEIVDGVWDVLTACEKVREIVRIVSSKTS